jgi:PAS domain S-box-containing protein
MDSTFIPSLFESMNEGLALLDEGNTVIFCNTAFRTLRQTGSMKLNNASVLEIYPQSQRREVEHIIERLREEGGEGNYEVLVNTETGRTFTDTYYVIKDAYGGYKGIFLRSKEVFSLAKGQDGKTFAQKYVSKDVGEVKKDKTIREITNRRRKEILALCDFSAVLSVEEDKGAVFSKCLKFILELFSLEAGTIRLLDKKKHKFSVPLAHQGVSENFRRQISNLSTDNCFCGDACRKKQIIYSSDISADMENTCPYCMEEGFRTSIAVPLYLEKEPAAILQLASHRKKPIEDDDMKLLTMVGNFLSIVLAQERFKEKTLIAREYLKGIITTSKDPITIADTEGTIIDINPALEKVTGYNRKSLIKTPLLKLFPEHMRGIIADLRHSILADGKLQEFDTSVLDSAGNSIPVTLSSTILRRPDGKPLGTIGVYRERKEEKFLNDEIKRRNKEFTFFYTLSLMLSQHMGIGEFIEKTLSEAFKLMEILPKGCVYEYKIGTTQIELLAQVNMNPRVASHERAVDLGECICNSVIESGQMLISESPGKDMDYTHHEERWNIILPLKFSDRVHGILILYSTSKPDFDAAATQMLITISNIIGAAMEKHHLYRESINLYEQLKK